MVTINKLSTNVYEILNDGKQVVLNATSKADAQQKYDEFHSEIVGLKRNLINEAKSTAKHYLSETDYLIQRHFEEITLKVATTLTDTEYKALLTKRNQARIDSNTEEALIKAKTDITELEKIKIAEKGK